MDNIPNEIEKQKSNRSENGEQLSWINSVGLLFELNTMGCKVSQISCNETSDEIRSHHRLSIILR